jgi:DNA polymerase-3 subunit epsilon
MSHLFFDTETTGLPIFKLDILDPQQTVRICQLAALLTDDQGNEIESLHTLIKPEGWTIEPGAAAVHGISLERCHEEGMPMEVALARFNSMKEKCAVRIGYNVSFDKQMMLREAHLLGIPHNSDGKETVCVMRLATPICKIPPTGKMMKAGFKKFKNPKLTEAYHHFFGKEVEKAHDAMGDVRATKELYFHIINLPQGAPEAVAV